MEKKKKSKKGEKLSGKKTEEVSTHRKDDETIKIGNIEFKLPYSYLLPPLSEVKFQEMCDNIVDKGVLVQIIVDEDYNVIDGEHRLRAAAENKQGAIPFDIRLGLTEEEKVQLVLDLNLLRRHLTPKQIQELIVKFRAEGRSLRQISQKLGISHTTVGRKLAGATVTDVTIELPNKIVGRDNKKRAARVKPKQKPHIAANTLKELSRAVDACNIAGSKSLPNKMLTLRRVERIVREKEKQQRDDQECTDMKLGKYELLFGDFQERGNEIPDESLAMIFTDPPYAKDYLPLWNELGSFANRVLKPSGLLVSYTGALYLPQIFEMLGQHLNYVWPASIYHTGGKKLVRAVNVFQAWKPILIYQKPPRNIYWKPFTDKFSGGQSKDNHEWEQSIDEAAYYIRALCPENGVLLDPMCGSGTTLIAGLTVQKGLRCIGIEIDKATYATAQERIQKALTDTARPQAS